MGEWGWGLGAGGTGGTVLDLDLMGMKYCRLMEQIWSDVPVEWRGGLIQRRPRPADHRCNKRLPQRKMSGP